MDTVNEAWRKILASENQRTIIKILQIILISVLIRAKKLEFVNLESKDIDTVKKCDELAHIRAACFWDSYGQEQVKLSEMKQKFIDCSRSESTRIDIDRRDASRIANTIEVLLNATHTLLYFRNLGAHEHNPVHDPGHASALAGTVLHLTEQLAPEGETFKANVEKLRRDASAALKLCSAYYEEDDEQQEDSRHGSMPEEEQEGPNILLEKLKEFRSEWEKNFETLIQRVPDEEKWRSIASEVAEQSVRKIRGTPHQFSGDPEDSQDGFEEFLEFPSEEESSEEGRAVSPFLTPIQAENALIALRNRINDEFRWNNAPIEPWENVLQRPIIRQMIEERIADVEQWKKAGGKIKERYRDKRNRSKAMDAQLEQYCEEIFAIMSSIADSIPADDEVPF